MPDFVQSNYLKLVSVCSIITRNTIGGRSMIPVQRFVLPTQANLEAVLALVCDHFELKKEMLKGPRRSEHIAIPRHIAVFLMLELCNASLKQVGHILGDRDHSTVIHSRDTIEAELESVFPRKAWIKPAVEDLRRKWKDQRGESW